MSLRRAMLLLLSGVLLAVACGGGPSEAQGIVEPRPAGSTEEIAARLFALLEETREGHGPSNLFENAKSTAAFTRFSEICDSPGLAAALDRPCSRGVVAATTPWRDAPSLYADAFEAFIEVVSRSKVAELNEKLSPDEDLYNITELTLEHQAKAEELIDEMRAVRAWSPVAALIATSRFNELIADECIVLYDRVGDEANVATGDDLHQLIDCGALVALIEDFTEMLGQDSDIGREIYAEFIIEDLEEILVFGG